MTLLFESLSSTPEHLVSDNSVFNLTSDCSDVNPAGDVPLLLTTFVESSLDVQSPEHKRTRRHAQKHGGRAKKKHHKAVPKAETKLSDDAMNLAAEAETKSTDHHRSNTSDVQSLSEHWNFDTFNSQHSDVVTDVLPDTVTGDVATQVVRQPSYLKAVGIRHDNAITSQQPNNCSVVEQSAITQASRDNLSSHASDKTSSKCLVLFYLLLLQINWSRQLFIFF